MDHAQIVEDLKEMKITPPDTWRAGLYYDYLVLAQEYFFETLDQNTPLGIGVDEYWFVSNALHDPGLLETLSEILDEYTAAAVQNGLMEAYKNGHGPNSEDPWNYEQYFKNKVFDESKVEYERRVKQFRTDFPIHAHAIKQLTENYLSNVRRCCERVNKDIKVLTKWYSDKYPKLCINRLTKIKSTGSDFHKGGAQVLILTFAISYENKGTKQDELKIVYKPGDLEADCLIVGDSASINRVIPDFMEMSLLEIYNLCASKFPIIDALPQRTYRILPRVYNSRNGDEYPLKVREAYGYIEYLNYDLKWGAKEWYGYYPDSTSDFVVFKWNALAEITAFYQRAGAFCALAGTFSLCDIHLDNFRVRNLDPYAIDLELSLTAPVEEIQDTMLIESNYGAINGTDSIEFKWKIVDRNVPGKAQVNSYEQSKTTCNRLYRAEKGKQTSLVKVDLLELGRGFGRGMQIIRNALHLGAFDTWFKRLNDNVVLRFMVLGTKSLQDVSRQIYINELESGRGKDLKLDERMKKVLLGQITVGYSSYDEKSLPTFLAYQEDEAGIDFFNMDIPVYYYRVAAKQVDVYNSRGEIMQVPEDILTMDGKEPCRSKVGRKTYFDEPPVEKNVIKNQLEVLATEEGFKKRDEELFESILKVLVRNKTPNEIDKIISSF